jgi:hypothetical protein
MQPPWPGGGRTVCGTDIDSPILKTRRSDLRGRTPHQIRYLRNILEHDISFGVGRPAPARPIWPWPAPSTRSNATPSNASS